jgi:competence protein ComGC
MVREILIGVIPAVIVAIVLLVPRWIKRGASLPKIVDRLMRGLEAVLNVNEAQNHAIMLNTSATQGIIDALVSGKINGNIEKACSDTKEARGILADAGKELRSFLVAETTGGGSRS